MTPAQLLVRVRRRPLSVDYHPLLVLMPDGRLVLDHVVERLRRVWKSSISLIVSASEVERFSRYQVMAPVHFVHSEADLEACLEALHGEYNGPVGLVYPEMCQWSEGLLERVQGNEIVSVGERDEVRGVLCGSPKALECLRQYGEATGVASLVQAAAALAAFCSGGPQDLDGVVVRGGTNVSGGPKGKLYWLNDRKAVEQVFGGVGRTISRAHRVMFVTGGSGLSGAEVSLLQFAEETKAAGHQVAIATAFSGEITRRGQALGAEVYCDEVPHFGMSRSNVMYWRHFMRVWRPSVVHANFPSVPVSCLVAAFAESVPVVAHWHMTAGGVPEDELSWAQAVVCCSTAAAVALREAGVDERVLRVIPNLPPMPVQVEGRRTPGTDRDAFRLLCLARYSREKRHDVLIHAVRAAHEQGAKVRLDCYGDSHAHGATKDALVRSVLAQGLQHVIRLNGFTSDPQARISESDAVLLASDREAGPLCLLEAMAMGRPFVATGVPGAMEVTQGKGGLFVECGDFSAMADAIVRLASDASIRTALAAEGAAEVSRQRVLRRGVPELVSIYDELTGLTDC